MFSHELHVREDMDLSPRMAELLQNLAPHGTKPVEMYRHSWSTARALAKRGLARVQWIGMGWFRVALTPSGLQEGRKSEGVAYE